MSYGRAKAAGAVVLGMVGSAAAVGVVALVPVYVSFPVAIAMAAGWCIWLERHLPDTVPRDQWVLHDRLPRALADGLRSARHHEYNGQHEERGSNAS